MICPHCNGSGRQVSLSGFGRGKEKPYMTQSIGPCPHCHAGHQHCCEGDRADVLVAVGELADGTEFTVSLEFECNPNEGS
jgi:hypothetical protein